MIMSNNDTIIMKRGDNELKKDDVRLTRLQHDDTGQKPER